MYALYSRRKNSRITVFLKLSKFAVGYAHSKRAPFDGTKCFSRVNVGEV